MSVTAKPLIDGKFASNSNTNEYQAPASTRTIIDKFTAFNSDSGAVTVTIHIVKSGQAAGDQYAIVKTLSIAAGATDDIDEMKNQILGAGDFVNVIASVANKLAIRMSGREVT